ncbi:MAG: hypothetical protein KatS3mg019_0315 [Fimbriimonadales bacterium]|nr:MAG: hypothetical protein KatS3mg019_0315 [Fimbriimonadales bacterium]
MARRKQIKGSLPIAFHNLGSNAAQQIDLAREALYTRMQNRLAELAVNIPVFLVDKAQMDAVAPPALQRGLNKDAVQRRLREALAQEEAQRESERRREEEISPIERAWDELQHGELSDKPNSPAPWKRFIPVGLYFGRHSAKPQFTTTNLNSQGTPRTVPDAVDAYQSANTPLIFICPERVIDWANRVNVDPNLVFDKILYHELGHAYMDTADTPSESVYDTAWGRVIEESFANFIAFSQFSGIEARYVQQLIATQPAEYQGYLLVNRLYPYPLIVGNDLYFESYNEFERYLYERYWRFADILHIRIGAFLDALSYSLSRDLWGTWTETDTNNSWRLGNWRPYKAHHRHSTIEMARRTRFWQMLAAQVVMHL